MNSIGIMQGRLSPVVDGRFQAFPVDSWREEFYHAKQAGLACIEWIYEVPNVDKNPLGRDVGVAEIAALAAATGVDVNSVCADYFMQSPLIRDGVAQREVVAHLKWLLAQTAKLTSVRYIVLPFVDQSSLQGPRDLAALLRVLAQLLPVADRCGIELHLEADLNPVSFAQLLAQVDHPCLRANHDIGNSAALGYAPEMEWAQLASWISSIHVKDRELGGGTVPLGTGSADFKTSFRMIKNAGFDRCLILQAARQTDMTEVDLARYNRQFVEKGMAD